MHSQSFIDDDDYYLEDGDENSENVIEEQEVISVDEFLIGEVMLRPPLWDCRLSVTERSKGTRDKLWLEIYKAFGEKQEYSIQFLIKKWRNLRDTYVRVKGEIESHVPSGSGTNKRKRRTLEFYDMMSFLRDTIKYHPTVTNLSTAQKTVVPQAEIQNENENPQGKVQNEYSLPSTSKSYTPRSNGTPTSAKVHKFDKKMLIWH